jgi:putative FmdB family regulatory protein
MPLYEYRCPQCGPFDLRRAVEEASAPLECPTCDAPARRVYSAPGTTSVKGPLSRASAAERARIDRSLSGEPVVTGPARGRRLPTGGHHH